MKLGIDCLISDNTYHKLLTGKRVALAANPASVTSQLTHSLDAISEISTITLSAAFGPQHGMRGDKQDNMIESGGYIDRKHNIPVFSLYGNVRRPSDDMMSTFDVLLYDIQDLGCRIYTYITTLLYLMEACAKHQKSLWVLDRPNPAGRSIEGNILSDGWQSFVGAGHIVMRHGLTVGELAKWFAKYHNIDVDLRIIEMQDYKPNQPSGYGWPVGELPWVNPSPNASSLNMARIYPGSVLIEGTELSEGRGTTIPLEIIGAPDIDIEQLLKKMYHLAPHWMQGAYIRPLFFEPTFHKHAHTLCQGIQIHTDTNQYQPDQFKPFRLILLLLKAIRVLHPDYQLWRKFEYEYETERLAFDVINGGTSIRTWIDDHSSSIADMETLLANDEHFWSESINEFLLY
ncbi:MAG: DUF1343 domain-containing protein [Gammaproteobacteria bacterium]|nr:DUF1343 domain-containing protein [Gammaproteobacteria bacterium]